MRQLIIARKDLQMSPGKLAAQCCHAAMAFLTNHLRDESNVIKTISLTTGAEGYTAKTYFSKEVYEEWIRGVFTKTICEARNRNQLMKAVEMAKELGLEEGKDFFLIKDCCLTELNPEEVDENGVGRTLTCIGFRPLPDELAHQISRKYQLYR
ncbi:MAG: peptidyl-tRNA hydrolase [Clostridia bacterium]|nr:peptidyl-tRNA hydrolase [Clostridia bacterium]